MHIARRIDYVLRGGDQVEGMIFKHMFLDEWAFFKPVRSLEVSVCFDPMNSAQEKFLKKRIMPPISDPAIRLPMTVRVTLRELMFTLLESQSRFMACRSISVAATDNVRDAGDLCALFARTLATEREISDSRALWMIHDTRLDLISYCSLRYSWLNSCRLPTPIASEDDVTPTESSQPANDDESDSAGPNSDDDSSAEPGSKRRKT